MCHPEVRKWFDEDMALAKVLQAELNLEKLMFSFPMLPTITTATSVLQHKKAIVQGEKHIHTSCIIFQIYSTKIPAIFNIASFPLYSGTHVMLS
jgi:hypothetical protein